MRSVVVDPDAYDWEGDAPLRRPFATTVIYEMHVAGLHAASELGRRAATARDVRRHDREDSRICRISGSPRSSCCPCSSSIAQDCPPGLVNYWGYSPGLLLRAARRLQLASRPAGSRRRVPRPRQGAAPRRHRGDPRRRLQPHGGRQPRRADAVASAVSTTSTYYLLEADRARYADYTGTGNTLNANDAVVRRLIVDSLRYWVAHMHVDGFRFDLASVLSRDESGRPLAAAARPVGHRVGSGPGRDQADRRGLGRRRALPGRQLRRRRVAGVEREVPRRRPPVREVGQRHRARLRLPLLRQPGSLRARGARAGAEHQLRHVARRVHAERPGQLQRQAQRGERRGRPRRVRREPELELRGRRADGRSRRSSGCAVDR